MYDGCLALFTCKTNEKTKLLFIDKKGFDLYIKDFLLAKHQKVHQFYQNLTFLKETRQTFRGLLRLVLMTEMKKILAKTVAVQQGDQCKYLYFVNNGQFTILRKVGFIDKLEFPLEKQFNCAEGLDRDAELIKAKSNLPYLDPADYVCS